MSMEVRAVFSKRLVVLLVVGVLLVAVGVALFPIVNYIVRQEIKKKVIISNTSELYEIWQEIPVPVYMQFYMFHVHNVFEIKAGEKPYVSQRGPYTYRERRVKYDIVWNSNGTVTYKQNRTFTFIPEMSVGMDTDLITTVNPLMATIAQGFQGFPTVIKGAISVVLGLTSGASFFMRRPVKEVLWGYADKSLTMLNKMLPMFFPSTEIGYFIGRNYTHDGIYTVVTGETDIGQLGKVQRFNGQSNVNIWTTQWARMVNGTDGTLGPPFSFDEEIFEAFVSDLCRSIKGVYRGVAYTPQQISLRRYGADPHDMANVSVNPDNIGFCTPKNRCLPSGLLNGTLCQKPINGFAVPLIFSSPHFLYADPEVVNSIHGINPDKQEHDTYIDIEPWTGLVLQVAKRLQINMFVQKVKGIIQTADIRTMYFPIFWLNESSVTDDKHANMLKDQLFTPLLIVKVGQIVLLCIGSIIIILGIVLLLRKWYLLKKVRSRTSLTFMNDSAERDNDDDLLMPNSETFLQKLQTPANENGDVHVQSSAFTPNNLPFDDDVSVLSRYADDRMILG